MALFQHITWWTRDTQKETTGSQCYPETQHHVTSNLSLLSSFCSHSHCYFTSILLSPSLSLWDFPSWEIRQRLLPSAATVPEKRPSHSVVHRRRKKVSPKSLQTRSYALHPHTAQRIPQHTTHWLPKPNEKKSFNNSKAHHRIKGIITNCTHLNMV